MNSKIILCGKTASGKTEFGKCLTKMGLVKEVGCTTRPIRKTETDGIDNWFLTKSQFRSQIKKKKFIEHTVFNGWYYGMLAKDFEFCDFLICNTVGLKSLSKIFGRSQFFVVYLDAPDDLIRDRLVRRGDNVSEIERRMKSDTIDFQGFKNYDLCIDIATEDTLEYWEYYSNLVIGVLKTR